MWYLGVDVGSEYTKAALVQKNGSKPVYAMVPTGLNMDESIEGAIAQALANAGIDRSQVAAIGATGAGAKNVSGAITLNEYSAAALGAWYLVPSARTVLDVGAEEARGVRCDEKGRAVTFAANEKCAAGAGSFVGTMAKAIEVKLEEFADLSLQSTAKIPLNAQCVIFAESEVVSLIHSDVSQADISKAVHDAMAERIGAVLRRVGLKPDYVVVGGLALNKGFIHALRSELNIEITVPSDPQHVSALGAALSVAEGVELVGVQAPSNQEG